MHTGGDITTRSRQSSYVENYEATNTTSFHQSPDSSSSGDPGDSANPSRTGHAGGNVESMSVDDSAFFDWGRFDFTYDGEDFN